MGICYRIFDEVSVQIFGSLKKIGLLVLMLSFKVPCTFCLQVLYQMSAWQVLS